MKKSLLAVSIGIISAGLFAELPPYPADLPARNIEIGNKPLLTINATTPIVIAPDASPVTRFAAEELQEALSHIFGRKPSVRTTLPSGSGTAIVLGLNEWSRGAGIDGTKLARDGFVIRTSGGNVYIAGRDDPADIKNAIAKGGAWSFLFERATLFGVYDFLERFAHARFYFPGELGTVLPEASFLNIPECSISDRPDFLLRRVSTFYDGTYFEGGKPNATINPAKNLNMLRLRLESIYIPCVHGLNKNNYLERFKDKPEYFALLSNGLRSNNPAMNFPGQLCFSSGIREEIYQDVVTLLTGKGIEKRPGLEKSVSWKLRRCYPGFADIMPQDGFQPCQCSRCRNLYTKETHYAADLIWNFVAEIANRLKKENIPGIVTMMGYRPYRRVPAVELPDNVMVMVAETGPWSLVDPGQHEMEASEIRGWTQKLGHRVWLWNYTNKIGTLAMPGIPCYSPHAIGKYYQEVAPWIFGAFCQSEGDRFLFMALNYYVFSKVAWNNRFDYHAAVEEFYRVMFGAAASDMKSFFDRIESIWVYKIAGRMVDTNLGPVGAPPSDYDLWNKIYTPQVLSGMEAAFDSAMKKVAPESLEARRITLFRREFLDNIRKASEVYRKRSNVLSSLHFSCGREYGNEIYLVPFQDRRKQRKTTCRTRVAAALDGKTLRIRFRCDEPQMKEILAVERKHDDQEIWKDNSVEVFLNPSGDRKTYFHILVNSRGSLADAKVTRLGARSQFDWSWDSHAEVEVKPLSGGFEIDLAVPIERLPDLKADAFPANFCRNRILSDVSRIETLYTWSPFIRNFHDLENFGTIGTGGGNLLVNGDFSLPPAGWSSRHWGIWDAKRNWVEGWIGGNTRNPDAHVRDEKVFFSAPASLRLTAVDSNASVVYWSVNRLQEGRRYRLSFMVRLDSVQPVGKGGGVVVNIQDTGNRWFPPRNWLTGTTDWIRQSFEFTAAKGTNTGKQKAKISLVIYNARGTAWFDDVKIEEL